MSDKPNILVLCTGNSCRSQIAEGYLKHFAADRFNAFSAGSNPSGRVHPLAVQVMAEDGIDLAEHRSKHLKEFLGHLPLKYLILVCGGANETCPRVWPGVRERLFWPFEDPATFQGTPDETLSEFRRIRDQIKGRILSWLEEVSV